MSVPYDHEQDDAFPTWEQDTRIACEYCGIRVRMPGHPVCSYCDWVLLPYVGQMVEAEFASFLSTSEGKFGAYCAENDRVKGV